MKNRTLIIVVIISSFIVIFQYEKQIEVSINIVEICDWQGCAAGAASISVDDNYASCRDKLNAYGWKGTYFLMSTQAFSQSTWNLWKSIYNEGHELGAHTQTHPCSQVSDSTLRSELSSNINDILTHVSMPKEELTTFAWPCGFNTEHEKEIASEYFISTRGYHINELEDKNPLDFMELKSLNTPYYHEPSLQPPDYRMMADLAESEGKWVNFVFHNECEDDGAIDYLSSKNLWVAPIGRVTKYIIERQNANIITFQNTSSTIKFDLIGSLNYAIFNQELTLKVFMGEKTAKILKINGVNKAFNSFSENGKEYIKFNMLPTNNDKIEITSETQSICGDGICNSDYGETSQNCPSDCCNPIWSCTSWSPSTCPSSCIQTRTCTDSNSCGTTAGKPAESQSCTGGSCSSGTCPTTICNDGIISYSEFLPIISKWLGG